MEVNKCRSRFAKYLVTNDIILSSCRGKKTRAKILKFESWKTNLMSVLDKLCLS